MEKILLVEDDPFMLKSLERLLSSRGYEVVAVNSGYEALDKAAAEDFALVITDVRMPGLDGIETLGRVGAVRPSARKIVITGYAEEEAPIRAIQVSVDDYLKKPFGSEVFFRSIEVALSRFRLEKERSSLMQKADGLLASVASFISASLPWGENRTKRMEEFCDRACGALQIPEARQEVLKHAVRLHDLGYILGRPENEPPDLHARRGSEILKKLLGHEEAAILLERHHEEANSTQEGMILRLSEELERLKAQGFSREEAEQKLREEAKGADPRLLSILSSEAPASSLLARSDEGGRYEPLLRLAQTYTLIGETEMAAAALEKIATHPSLLEKDDFRFRYLLASARQSIRKSLFSEGLKAAQEARELSLSHGLGEEAFARASLEVSHAKLLLATGENLGEPLIECDKTFEKHGDAWNQARARLYYALQQDGKGSPMPMLQHCFEVIPPDQREEWAQGEMFTLGLRCADPIRRDFLQFFSGREKEIRVHLVGPFRVYRNGTLIKEEEWKARKAKLLLAYLLFNQGRPASEDRLFDLFWGESDAEKARKNLHHAVYLLRRVLEPDLADGSQSKFVKSKKTSYQLEGMESIWWDVAGMRKWFEEGEALFAGGDDEKGAAAFQQVEQLYQGELLEEFPEESWCLGEREKLNQLYFKAMLRLASFHEKKGNFAASQDFADRVLALDPFHEEAAVQKIRALFKAGHRSEAIRRYHDWCDRLKREMNLQPPPELLALYLEMTGGA